MSDWGHFDGASRGNPGPAGAGALLYLQGKAVWRRALPLGQRTNNEAEYLALKLLMDEIAARGLKGLEIRGDSRLVICQMNGQWKIKEPRLRELAAPLQALARELNLTFRWIPREENSQADQLSNIALDRGALEERLDSPADLPRPPAEPPFSAKKISAAGWLIAESGQEYLLDLAHRCCSCPQWRETGRCRHMEQLQQQGENASPFADLERKSNHEE